MIDDRSPHLLWTEDDAPRSGRFGDVYFSREDGLAETRAVFLAGCGLPDAWAGRRHFTVAELGFGTGLNIAALLDLWRDTAPANAHLHIFSIEGFPLTRDEAARALAAWPELSEPVDALLAGWPDPVPGMHRIDLPGFRATLDLAIGPVQERLAQWSGQADAWFLDGFAPSTNPDMWSEPVFDLIVARSQPGASVATFTVAGAVRRGLAARGFVVDKRPGHGRKRERLEARLPGQPPERPSPRIVIVGAGIAGASLARAFHALGVTPTVIEMAGGMASGFPAALVTPRLDAGDLDIAGLYAAALQRAAALYRSIPDAVVQQGVLQLEQAPRDAARFAKIAAQDLWPARAMTVLDAAACSERLNEDLDQGGLLMNGALAIHPKAVLDAWLAQSPRITASVAQLERAGAGWRLMDAQGQMIADADVVVLAAGWGNAALSALPLSPVAGQADWIETLDDLNPGPVAWGGYAAPTTTGLLFGATHERGQTDPVISDDASARNLDALRSRLRRLAAAVEIAGSSHAGVAVRATTPDRMPLAGAIDGGLYILGGLGSRGFCAAPLLAEHVVGLALGVPSPLPNRQADRVEPLRFSTAAGLAQPTVKADD